MMTSLAMVPPLRGKKKPRTCLGSRRRCCSTLSLKRLLDDCLRARDPSPEQRKAQEQSQYQQQREWGGHVRVINLRKCRAVSRGGGGRSRVRGGWWRTATTAERPVQLPGQETCAILLVVQSSPHAFLQQSYLLSKT